MLEYFDLSKVFLIENIVEFPKYTKINNYIIKLEKNKKRLLNPIYSLRLVKLEKLKIYIKINLVNNFTYPPKFPARVSKIIFDCLEYFKWIKFTNLIDCKFSNLGLIRFIINSQQIF